MSNEEVYLKTVLYSYALVWVMLEAEVLKLLDASGVEEHSARVDVILDRVDVRRRKTVVLSTPSD